MPLFGRAARRPPTDGIEGTAVIRDSARRQVEPVNSGVPWWWEDLEPNVLGKRTYRLTLEVRLPGREPYEVEGKFRVPKRAENISLLNIQNKLPEGLELPVRVDPSDADRVAIDWDRFLASPGRKQAMREGVESARRRQARQDLERKPKLAARIRASNTQAVQAWADAVRAGGMSREQFERTVSEEVEAGRMDPADAEAARRALDAAAGAPAVPAPDQRESARIRKQGRKTTATVLERADTGQTHRGAPIHRLRLEVEGREVVHHEMLNDAWAALLEPGMATDVHVDPADPGRIALG